MSYIKVFLIAIYAVFIAIITILLSPLDYLVKGRITFVLSKIFSRVVLFIAGVKVKVEGREFIDTSEEYIYITNHQSLFDIPILMQAVPSNIRFIYKKSLTKVPIFGWGMFLGGYIPINREDGREAMKTLKFAAQRIARGISIVIFPEGTRSEEGTLGEFRRGAFVIADEAKVKIVAGTIIDSYKILSKGKLKINPGTVKVVFKKPLEYKKDKAFLQEIKEIIQSSLPNK
jgi:1-acyl-sn-glycerol-3-phosphate acyltransferase